MPRMAPLLDEAGELVPGRPLADWLVQQRRARGLTQRALAARIGVHDSVLALWEAGRRPVPAVRIAALAEVLDADAEVLLNRAPPPGIVRADPAWCLDEGEGCPCPRWTCLACGACWTDQAQAHTCLRAGVS